MQLTVGLLKKIIEQLDNTIANADDIILADLELGNTNFKPLKNIKHLLLIRGGNGWNNKLFLTINKQGAHFTKKGSQSDLKYIGHFDDDTLTII